MFHFDTSRSCLDDCPLNKSDLGLELCANVGCKSYQNIAGIRHDEVPTLWSRHEASYTHGPPCLSLTTRAHPNCPVRLSPRPNPVLRSYGGTGSEPSPLYGTPALTGWVFGGHLSNLPLCPLQRITAFMDSTPSKEHPRTAP